MDVLEELKACRRGAAETIAVMDVLIERFTRLAALGASVGPTTVKTNGHPPPPALPAPDLAPPPSEFSTRDLVLRAARSWTSAGEIIQAVQQQGGTTSSVYTMITNLVKERALQRKGSKASYQYCATVKRGGAKRSKRGSTVAAVLAASKDWVSFSDLCAVPGINRKSLTTAITRLMQNKELERRGTRMKYQYRSKG